MDTLPLLCLLGILSLALAIEKTVPPEDLDGSGDDEDFSGSGFDSFFVDLESKDVTVLSTLGSTLVPTVEGSTAAQEPEIVDQEETEMEITTKSAETTKTPNDVIEDLFAVETVAKEATTQEATTPPFQEITTVDLMEETATKKHHHHPHPHHHHHHTTTSSTSLPSELDGPDDDTTEIPPEVGKDPDSPQETTTGTPDEESELHHIPQELTTPVEDLAKHVILHEETISGSTSAYVDNEEITEEPLDVENIPALDSLVTTTGAADLHTHKDHHHRHHHHPHHTTTSSFDGDVKQDVTTRPSDPVEHEDNVQEVEHTTAVAEAEHPHHGHGPHIHHHETTPSTTVSTEPEKPHEVHTHEPKGRRVHVPDVKSTTAIPVINEDERIPDADAENDDLSAVSNGTRNLFDENDDSKEEGPSGVTEEDIFFESATASVNLQGRILINEPPATTDDNGTSNASQGIMGRKELLAGIIAGGVAGLVFAASLVAFVLYRMKKKDEGSYSLEEPKQSNGGYQKPREQREFYA